MLLFQNAGRTQVILNSVLDLVQLAEMLLVRAHRSCLAPLAHFAFAHIVAVALLLLHVLLFDQRRVLQIQTRQAARRLAVDSVTLVLRFLDSNNVDTIFVFEDFG